MPTPGSRTDLDALIAQVRGSRRVGPRCWAAVLQGEAAEFRDRLQALVDSGRHVLWDKAADVFATRYGVTRDPRQLSRHFRRLCSCWRSDGDA